jgi:hypothetical protein
MRAPAACCNPRSRFKRLQIKAISTYCSAVRFCAETRQISLGNCCSIHLSYGAT